MDASETVKNAVTFKQHYAVGERGAHHSPPLCDGAPRLRNRVGEDVDAEPNVVRASVEQALVERAIILVE
jgi:hypothetical protein